MPNWKVKQLVELLKDGKTGAKAETIVSTIGKMDTGLDDNIEKTTVKVGEEAGSSEKGKKLVSGKCTKPDEADIKKVVRFPHKHLDSRHARNRCFDKLPFSLLIAGELELIAQEDITSNVRKARTAIARTLCYHKTYLDDENLRDGYDHILKKVKRGAQEWDEVLGEHLHEYLHYRANVILRQKLQEEPEQGFTKVEHRKNGQQNRRSLPGKASKQEETIIYCHDYNRNECVHRDHHEGHFNGQKVVKFHICRKCHASGEIKSHREGEDSCPRKGQ